jgi:dolichyl-phosphate-mannose-protein mannosyltransferase
MPPYAGSSGASAGSRWQRFATAARTAVRPNQRHLVAAALIAIVATGGWVRLSGANWDSGQHLHPDERHLSQVAGNIRWPDSPLQYFDVGDSPLSPYNTEPGRSYLYGMLPLLATKAAAAIVGHDDYGRLNIAGRRLSALVDTGSILLVFVLVLMLLEGCPRDVATAGALTAAALYAFTVTVIQAAHFFTMESWLVFFGLLTFWLAARAVRTSIAPTTLRFRPIYALVGVSLGLTVACKASGALIAVPILVGLLGEAALTARRAGYVQALIRVCASASLVVVTSYIAFRAVSPYSFATSNWFDVSINPAFRDALQSQQDAIEGKFLYPPAYQWLLSSPIWDPLENLFLWQLGPGLAATALVGLAVAGYTIAKPLVGWLRGTSGDEPALERQAVLTILLMLLVFVLVVFFYFGSKFAHTGRYQLPLVPFAVAAASYGLVLLFRSQPVVLAVVATAVVAATGLYALAYHHIYTRPTTRVAANEWIARHVQPGTTVANEHWDDSLPVGSLARQYRGIVLPVFDQDDSTKLRKLYDRLAVSEFYFVSSPRAWRTIGRLPDRFPIMTRFYRLLLAGRLGFSRVAEFTSEPELLGVQLHDLEAEEAFWVYDHPPVRIYRKVRPLGWDEFRHRLCEPPPHPPGC